MENEVFIEKARNYFDEVNEFEGFVNFTRFTLLGSVFTIGFPKNEESLMEQFKQYVDYFKLGGASEFLQNATVTPIESEVEYKAMSNWLQWVLGEIEKEEE